MADIKPFASREEEQRIKEYCGRLSVEYVCGLEATLEERLRLLRELRSHLADPPVYPEGSFNWTTGEWEAVRSVDRHLSNWSQKDGE